MSRYSYEMFGWLMHKFFRILHACIYWVIDTVCKLSAGNLQSQYSILIISITRADSLRCVREGDKTASEYDRFCFEGYLNVVRKGKHLTSFASVYLSSSRLPLSHQSNGRSLSTCSWYFMSRSCQHNQGIVNVGRMYALLAHGLLRLLFGLLAAWRKFDVRVGVILMLDCLMDIEFLLLCKCKTFSQRFT